MSVAIVKRDGIKWRVCESFPAPSGSWQPPNFTVVIALKDERYDDLIVEVADPKA